MKEKLVRFIEGKRTRFGARMLMLAGCLYPAEMGYTSLKDICVGLAMFGAGMALLGLHGRLAAIFHNRKEGGLAINYSRTRKGLKSFDKGGM